MNKLKYISSVVVASALIIGCGVDDSVNETTDVTIERGPVLCYG